MPLKGAFIFIAPNADSSIHKTEIDTGEVILTTVGVKSYEDAVEAAIKLADEGVTAFELCAGFGNRGTYLVSEAVKGRGVVGAVRFDLHPGLGNKSGDEVF
ncbi:MAG: DUF6506 family protein [Sedimentibacter sp.]|uniref:DUF6506 family protein n=1 Tax=Sedimentibacter sp. TaxID=1960295 RepID=UPI00315971B2